MNSLPDYKVYKQPGLKATNMLVCWENDAGRIGSNIFNCLNNSFNLELFCEIEPNDFFTLGGVIVENNIARFPEVKFYYSAEKNLIVLHSAVPKFEWYKYISLVFEVMQNTCGVSDIYTVGGIIAVTAHTVPRMLMATMNKPDCKLDLESYDISLNLDYETAPGQRPTMSSYLIWEALQRNVSGISLWVSVPFYMVGVDDLQACKKTVDFLSRKFKVNLDSSKLDEDLKKQTQNIARIMQQYPDLQELIMKLETSSSLSESESGRLVEKIEECLKQIDAD